MRQQNLCNHKTLFYSITKNDIALTMMGYIWYFKLHTGISALSYIKRNLCLECHLKSATEKNKKMAFSAKLAQKKTPKIAKVAINLWLTIRGPYHHICTYASSSNLVFWQKPRRKADVAVTLHKGGRADGHILGAGLLDVGVDHVAVTCSIAIRFGKVKGHC